MQPIVGIMADKSTSKWGRRRPVMVGGTVIVSICLLILGWTKEIVAAFIEEGELVGQSKAPDCNMRIVFDILQRREATIFLAVLSIYALDFAINAVQSSCRSLIVDTLPIPKQQLGSAWGKFLQHRVCIDPSNVLKQADWSLLVILLATELGPWIWA